MQNLTLIDIGQVIGLIGLAMGLWIKSNQIKKNITETASRDTLIDRDIGELKVFREKVEGAEFRQKIHDNSRDISDIRRCLDGLRKSIDDMNKIIDNIKPELSDNNRVHQELLEGVRKLVDNMK